MTTKATFPRSFPKASKRNRKKKENKLRLPAGRDHAVRQSRRCLDAHTRSPARQPEAPLEWRLTAAGSLYLGLVALIPVIAIGLLSATAQFPLGGTSILIMVGVGLDTVKQIESQLQQRNYEGFLR